MTEVPNRLVVALNDNSVALERFALSQSVLDHASVGMVILSADDMVAWANLAMDDSVGISRARLVRSSSKLRSRSSARSRASSFSTASLGSGLTTSGLAKLPRAKRCFSLR